MANWFESRQGGSNPLLPDLYAVLGLPSTANSEEIRRAYHRLVKEHHPDTKTDDGTPDTTRFLEVTEAYKILSEERQRQAYDRRHFATRFVTRTEQGTTVVPPQPFRGETPQHAERTPPFDEGVVRSRIAEMDNLQDIRTYVESALLRYPEERTLSLWDRRVSSLILGVSSPEVFATKSALEKTTLHLAYQALMAERYLGAYTFRRALESLKPVFVPFEAKSVIDRHLDGERRKVHALSTDSLVMAVQELKTQLERDPEWQQWEQYAPNVVSDINTIVSVLEIQRGKPISYVDRAVLCNNLMHLRSNIFTLYCEDITMKLSTYFVDSPNRITGDFPTLSQYLSFISNEKLTNIPMARDAWKKKEEDHAREQVVFGRDILKQLASFVTSHVDWNAFIRTYTSPTRGILWQTFFARGVYVDRSTEQEQHVAFEEMSPIIQGILRSYLEKELQQYAKQVVSSERGWQFESLNEFLSMVDLAGNREASLAIHNMMHLWDSMSRTGILRRLITIKALCEELSVKKGLESLPLPELIRLLDQKNGIMNRRMS